MPSQVKAVGHRCTVIVHSPAEALAPVLYSLLSAVVIALAPAILLPEIPLSDVAGMAARGDAVNEEPLTTGPHDPGPLDRAIAATSASTLTTPVDDISRRTIGASR